MAKICRVMLLLLAGCSSSVESKPADVEAFISSVDMQARAIETKQDATITVLKENTAALGLLKTSVEKLTEASLAKSNPIGKESDPASALEQPPAKNANDSQPSTKIVAEPGAVSSGRITSDGTRLRRNVSGNWNPTILETSAHLAREHGIDTNGMSHQQMADIHADLHDGKPVATKSKPVVLVNRGGGCPGGVCPTPRRGLFGRRR